MDSHLVVLFSKTEQKDCRVDRRHYSYNYGSQYKRIPTTLIRGAEVKKYRRFVELIGSPSAVMNFENLHYEPIDGTLIVQCPQRRRMIQIQCESVNESR